MVRSQNQTKPAPICLLYKPIKLLIYVVCLLIQFCSNVSTDFALSRHFAAEHLKLHSSKYFYSFKSFELEVCGRENFVSRAKQSHVVFVQKSKLNNTYLTELLKKIFTFGFYPVALFKTYLFVTSLVGIQIERRSRFVTLSW